MCSSGLGQGGRVAWGGIAAGRAARVVGDLRFLQLVVIGWGGVSGCSKGENITAHDECAQNREEEGSCRAF